MRRYLFILLLIRASASANPILPGADPHALRVGDTYWIYPTEAGAPHPIFAAYRSQDLITWSREAVILKLSDVSWVQPNAIPKRRAWAPAMLEKNSKFFFYYSVGPQTPEHPSQIGVAMGASASGPFQDSGKPLLTGGNGFEAIDPMAFTDPSSGKTYLYVGGSAGAKLRVFEMNDDLVSFKREVDTVTPPQFTEGPFLHKRENTYYLSYSHGRWNKDDYSVHYATASSPIGPWKYQGCILSKDDERQGPGHHSFIETPKGEWYIVYHRWETRERPGPYSGKRMIAIDKVNYDNKGKILPVIMTGKTNSP